MEYSIEKLAEQIQDNIEFEDCELYQLPILKSFKFDDFYVFVNGYAKGFSNSSAESVLEEIYIENCYLHSVQTGIKMLELGVKELYKLEKLISW